jgi:hypothetical protein
MSEWRNDPAPRGRHRRVSYQHRDEQRRSDRRCGAAGTSGRGAHLGQARPIILRHWRIREPAVVQPAGTGAGAGCVGGQPHRRTGFSERSDAGGDIVEMEYSAVKRVGSLLVPELPPQLHGVVEACEPSRPRHLRDGVFPFGQTGEASADRHR